MREFLWISFIIILAFAALVKGFSPTGFLFGRGMVGSVQRVGRTVLLAPLLAEDTVVSEVICVVWNHRQSLPFLLELSHYPSTSAQA